MQNIPLYEFDSFFLLRFNDFICTMKKGLFLINQSAPYLNFCHFIRTGEAVSSTLTVA